MRNVRVFGGSSHPALTELICAKLGTRPSECTLEKYANGEISVQIGCSIRDQHVFVVQSGSSEINDSIMELLILISACKGGSANKITAVLPYFPYSRQSKRKSQRGAITARMLANLLSVAGVHHIITLDLHASQMQGFFGRPVDDLHAEPLIARWIQHNVSTWRDAVVVSKNPGGTKRVTSLADVLKLNFGIVTTDRRRGHLGASMILESVNGTPTFAKERTCQDPQLDSLPLSENPRNMPSSINGLSRRPASEGLDDIALDDDSADDSGDGRAQNVITGRLVHGQLVDDDYSSPASSTSASMGPAAVDTAPDGPSETMAGSMFSTSSRVSNGAEYASVAGVDGAASSEEEEEVQEKLIPEQLITIVGNVRGKTVFIVDDIIDKARSWIAAAETVVKRGGARQVYCIATHGLLGANSLEELVKCESIDQVVVTNSCPISPGACATKKVVVLDISNLLAEAIRRNHFGESLSQLYQQLYE